MVLYDGWFALYSASHTEAVLLERLPPGEECTAGNQVGNSGQYFEGKSKDHTLEIPETLP